MRPDDRDMPQEEFEARALEALEKAKEAVSIHQLLDLMGVAWSTAAGSPNTVRLARCLRRWVALGIANSDGQGRYKIAADEAWN